MDRLDMQHSMMTALMNHRLFWAPIHPEPLKILDIGTGTGIWAIDCADMVSSRSHRATRRMRANITAVPKRRGDWYRLESDSAELGAS